MNKNQLWDTALHQLELRVSQGNFLTWFRNTKIRERDKSRVVIETVNPFAFEWLSKKYHALILDTLRGIDATIQHIDFAIAAQPVRTTTYRKSVRVIAQKQRPPLQPQNNQQSSLQQNTQPAPVPQSITPLNEKYAFETFIVGTSNEIAHAACKAVAAKPGDAYNPLFIYGGVGLGKTHLLQAIGNELVRSNHHCKVLYVSSERFINEFVEAIRDHTTTEFKKCYRNVDVLIMDDVQFLAGKDKTQEELFHTFNTLYGQNKQVILSSDRPPGAIPTFQERLSSRLAAGMIADIKKPDYETRLAILERKMQTKAVVVSADSLEFIAKNIQNNVRELEGALNRVVAYCELHNTRATIEYTKKILHDIIDQTHHKTIGTKQIIETVSSYYNLSTDHICGKSRKKEIVRPRQVAMYLLRRENNMSFPSIGEYFGGRDHTTAMHACYKIEKLLEHDEELVQEINFLKERLYA